MTGRRSKAFAGATVSGAFASPYISYAGSETFADRPMGYEFFSSQGPVSTTRIPTGYALMKNLNGYRGLARSEITSTSFAIPSSDG